MNRSIITPCVQVCEYDDARQVCFGCGRTMHEITNWQKLTDTERVAVMERAPRTRQSIANRMKQAGYSYQRIADILGVTKGTAKQMVFRARQTEPKGAQV